MKQIYLLGAFDRYNYGDVLFPVLINEFIKKYKGLNIENVHMVSLKKTDLSYCGGYVTEPLSDLYQKVNAEDIVIVVGGEILNASADELYLSLCDSKFELILKKISRKALGYLNLDDLFTNYVMKHFGIKNKFPFVFNYDDFNDFPEIRYNTVGGCKLEDSKEKEELIQCITQNSGLCTVRDKEILRILGLSEDKLFPDSAMIMSDIYPIERLEGSVKKEIIDFVKSNNYIAVQTNFSTYKKNKDKLANQIQKLGATRNQKILLLPIGFASDHDDLDALIELQKQISTETILFKEMNIFEIMYLIANTSFFIGTSLHGNITAMSYSTPHIGIGNIPKLDVYLKTWGIHPYNRCIQIDDISDFYTQNNYGKHSELVNNRSLLIELTKQNFDSMLNFDKVDLSQS